MDYNTALDICSKQWGVNKVEIENMIADLKRKMAMSPCARCEHGWGSLTSGGYKGCDDTCLTLKYWKEHYA